jgi:hypothetical protein
MKYQMFDTVSIFFFSGWFFCCRASYTANDERLEEIRAENSASETIKWKSELTYSAKVAQQLVQI